MNFWFHIDRLKLFFILFLSTASFVRFLNGVEQISNYCLTSYAAPHPLVVPSSWASCASNSETSRVIPIFIIDYLYNNCNKS